MAPHVPVIHMTIQVAWSLALAQDNRRTSDTSLSSKITTVKSAKTIRTSDSDDVHVVQAEEV